MKVGSIVECIRADWFAADPDNLSGYCPPRVGERFIVADVDGPPEWYCVDGIWIQLEGYPSTLSFYADYFREIEFPPQIEAEIKESLERVLIDSCK